MDVTKIQKLNEMDNQLKKHNIGYDTDSAISAAEKIYGTENIKESPVENSNDLDELRKEVRKLTIAIQRIVQELQETKKKQEELEKELNDAKLGIVKKAQKTLTNNDTSEEKQKKDLTKPIDRNNVAPSEVSVEKFFYFGNK